MVHKNCRGKKPFPSILKYVLEYRKKNISVI